MVDRLLATVFQTLHLSGFLWMASNAGNSRPVHRGSTSVSSHSFSPDQLMVDAEVHRPITTFVDRTSEDRRRVYHDTVPIEPPSPVKKARMGAPPTLLLGTHWETGSSDLPYGNDDESYQMHLDDNAEDPPVPPLPDLGRKRKAIYSDPTLYSWKENSQDRYIREFLRMDGRGNATENLCQWPAYRCHECKGALLFCKECSVEQHLENPLHIVEAWNGTRFLHTSLKAMGLRVQFGHPPGERCTNPERGREAFVVLHHNSIHEVAVDFCGVGCDNRARAGESDTQLLRGGWYPASEERPQTCMTLLALEQFHVQSLQAKITMYDYYQSLEKLTSNDGTKPPDRYQVFTRICREYRHVMMLKQMGRGHDPGGAKATKSGALAVLCPACPRPGINLPEDWEKAVQGEERFIYTLFLALDACFRMKRGLVSSELKDPGLGTGDGVHVGEYPVQRISVDGDRIRRSTTGVGMGVCARHEFIQPNGVGDLQKGEKICKHGLHICLHPPAPRPAAVADCILRYSLPVVEAPLRAAAQSAELMHIHAHTLLCGILYSLNLIPGSGQTDGEGIERRGATLRRRLDNALEQQMIQRQVLAVFSQQQQDWVEGWKKMVHDYEADRSKENPYEAVVVGLTEKEIRLQFQQEEEAEAKRGLPAKHKVTPSAFMTEVFGCGGRAAELKKAKTTTQQVDMGVLRTKLIRRLERLQKLQNTYSPGSIIALEKRKAPADEQPESEPLFLPSALTEAERGLGGCTEGLLEMELLMRDAQCHGAIVKLRNQLVIKARFLNYKSLHSRHQGANTRSRTIICLHSEKVSDGVGGIVFARGEKEAEMGWRKLRKADIRCMEDAEDVKRKAEKRKRAKERRKKKLEELLSHGAKLPVWAEEGSEDDEDLMEADTGTDQVTESRREVSWIWTGAALSGTDVGLEDGVRAVSKMGRGGAAAEREFRRVPITLEWQAKMWEWRASEVDVGTGVLEQAAGEESGDSCEGRQREEAPVSPDWTPYKTRWEETEETRQRRKMMGMMTRCCGQERTMGTGDEERGEIGSDEELVMGGEVDDF
ncbi:hypothetical protein B0H14DRAFT_2561881 [Mycena olivaceomarginata]|nr:hypothetical protein B0H14DRAFT_2561881 [Mycena olivaceomarginata]